LIWWGQTGKRDRLKAGLRQISGVRSNRLAGFHREVFASPTVWGWLFDAQPFWQAESLQAALDK
jgi:hypothetical protein